MRKIESVSEIAEILRTLADRDDPFVVRMAKEAGKRGIRYRHLLYPEGEVPASVEAGVAPSAGTAAGPDVLERLERVEGEMAALREEVVSLRRELESVKDALS